MAASASVVEQVRRTCPFPACRQQLCFALPSHACHAQPFPCLPRSLRAVLSCPQAQAARAAAVAEVQRLLATADDLKRLGALREDVAAKQQVRRLSPSSMGAPLQAASPCNLLPCGVTESRLLHRSPLTASRLPPRSP